MRETKTAAKRIVPVTITLKDGLVQCNPNCAYVRRGQTIEWNSTKNFPFTIHLGYNSPFTREQLQAPKQKPILFNIPKNTPHGRYKYVIALFDGSKVWIEDPEFIVRR
ncbi:MAG: hypothetical protein L6428_03320 [Candidatus Aminicenantes bacterium]|nr:hypothetical protein [Acidobacteriota bacterium]MCG2810475.1 hypothetical protein [Candidatus Aminicenantes bacterium]